MATSPGSSSSNPRKFSEKIALHNQKQAEETRAFDELMTDLTVSRVLVREVNEILLEDDERPLDYQETSAGVYDLVSQDVACEAWKNADRTWGL